MDRIHITISTKQAEWLAWFARCSGATRSEMIRRALDRYIRTERVLWGSPPKEEEKG